METISAEPRNYENGYPALLRIAEILRVWKKTTNSPTL